MDLHEMSAHELLGYLEAFEGETHSADEGEARLARAEVTRITAELNARLIEDGDL